MTKSDIRKTIRTYRKNLSSEQVQAASKKIAEKIIYLSEFINAKNIAYYVSHENEIDPVFIIQRAQELKKLLYLPILSDQNQLDFYCIDLNMQFIKNKFGIEEPIFINKLPILPNKLDIILMPLVAFDENNNRLGRGAGYYDRYLQFTKSASHDQKPILIGLAYEFQKIEKIIPESWDIKMDYVVTEGAIYHPRV